jgi:hypothetical protein
MDVRKIILIPAPLSITYLIERVIHRDSVAEIFIPQSYEQLCMPHQPTTFTYKSRHLFLYTSRYALQLQTLDPAGQLEQLRHPEQRASRRWRHKPVNPPASVQLVGSVCRRPSLSRNPDSILSPIPAADDQLKLPLEQWMVGMRYPEPSLLSEPLRRI